MSVYELSMADVVGTTPGTPGLLVVASDGAETRLQQVTSSLLQRLQLAEPPWEESRRFGGGGGGGGMMTWLDAPPPSSWPPESQQQPQRQRQRQQRSRVVSNAQGLPPPRDRVRLDPDTSGAPRVTGRRASAVQQQQQQEQPQPRAGIPIIRRTTPGERRDADGGFGDDGGTRQAGVPYESWAQPEERGRVPVGEPAQGDEAQARDARRGGRAFNPAEDML